MPADDLVRMRFGDFVIDLERYELRYRGEPRAVEPQVFDVLAYVFRHRDRLVTKEELLDNVWGDRFVSESALSTRIKAARRAIGDDGRRQEVIRTVHGRGFRVIAEVEAVDRDALGDASELQVPLPGRALRRPTSSFVGRDDEVAALSDLVGRSRVVTICGPGGVGKTRLALELAARVGDRYAHGARVLELAELEPTADVVAAVASAAGVQDRPGVTALERLVDTFASRRFVLVVDNCEHLVDAAGALVSALIEGGDGVDVIVTSRSPLHVDGEHVWTLEPLPTAVTEHDDPPAVRLFLDRASAQSGPEWTATLDRGLVRHICERVGGLPLGVELAASRARHLGLEALATALEDPTALSAVGGRTSRHRSVETVVAWSYDRLPPSQQRLFVRLSVFAGWFDASAAHRVAGDGAPFPVLLQSLSELVDQSMLALDPRPGTAHYSLLTPLREFGRRRLDATGQRESIHRLHAEWVLEAAEAADRSLRGPDAAAVMAWFEALVPELGLAVRHLLDARDSAGLAALCRSLAWFALDQGRVDLRAISRSALDGLEAFDTIEEAHEPSLAVVRAAAAMAAWQRGDLHAAEHLAEQAVATARDPRDAGLAQLALAQVRQLNGDHAGVVRLAASMSVLAEETGDALLGTLAHVAAALSLAAIGAAEDAQREAGVAREIAEGSGSALATAWAMYAEGESRLETSPRLALENLRAAWSLARSIEDRMVAGVAGLSAVSLLARLGQSDASLAEFGELIDHWARAGTAMHQWSTLRNLAEVLSRLEADEDSARLYGALCVAGRGAVVGGAEATRLDRAMQEVRDRLGDRAFAARVGEGAAMSDNAVVAYARRLCLPPAAEESHRM